MKMIMAILPRYRLDRVTRKLIHIEGFPGMTVVEGEGFGHEKLEEAQTAREALTDFTPNVRVEAVVPDSLVDSVIGAIVDGAHTGERGNGKIFVLSVEEAVRIKTGESGADAV